MNLSKIYRTVFEDVPASDIRIPPELAVDKSDSRFFSYDDLWNAELKTVAVPQADPLETVKKEQVRIQKQCAEMLADAKEQIKRLEKEAADKGFKRGQEDGLRKAEEQYKEKISRLAKLFTGIEGHQAGLTRQYEQQLLPLVKTMVDRLVNHEVSVNSNVIQACLRNALEFVVENSTVKVHLHKDDFNRIKEASLEDPTLLSGKNKLQLIEDPNISAGGCLLKTDYGEIDATMEQAREKLFTVVDKSFLAALALETTE